MRHRPKEEGYIGQALNDIENGVTVILKNNARFADKLERAVKTLEDLRHGLFKDIDAVNQLIDTTLLELKR